MSDVSGMAESISESFGNAHRHPLSQLVVQKTSDICVEPVHNIYSRFYVFSVSVSYSFSISYLDLMDLQKLGIMVVLFMLPSCLDYSSD